MNHEELIDKHFAGNLSAEETEQLLEAVEKNPHVAEEFKFQEELTTSIKVARKRELKATLASLPVPKMFNPTPYYLGAAAVIGILFTSIYFLNPSEDVNSVNSKEEIAVVDEETLTITDASEEETITEEIPTEIEESKEAIPTVEKSEKLTKTEVKTESAIVDQPTSIESKPKAKKGTYNYDIQEPSVNPGIAELDNVHEDADINAPSNNLTSTTKDNKVSEIVPKIEANNKSYRKYQYDGQNLTLIGDFNSDVPYVLYELKLNTEKQLYLKFENKYYAIKNTGSKTNKLETLTDQVVINELENK